MQRLPPPAVYAAGSHERVGTPATTLAREGEGSDEQAIERSAVDTTRANGSALGRDGQAHSPGGAARRAATPLADHGWARGREGGRLPGRSGGEQARAADKLGGVQPRRWLDADHRRPHGPWPAQ